MLNSQSSPQERKARDVAKLISRQQTVVAVDPEGVTKESALPSSNLLASARQSVHLYSKLKGRFYPATQILGRVSGYDGERE